MSKNPLKLPLRREPYSGSTDSRIVDASGEDIARISGGHDKTACIAYPDKVAKQIVGAVNGRKRLLKELDEANEKLEQRRSKTGKLKPINLDAISRSSDVTFTHIRLEDFAFREALTEKRDGVTYALNWLEFGECRIHNEGNKCFIGSRMGGDVLDFEHDTPYVVRIDLVGLTYEFTDQHISYFKAHLTPVPKDIQIYPADFDPKEVVDASMCDECDEPHLLLPDGYFTPPMYELAKLVAGKQVSISMGPRWNTEDDNE